MFCGDVFGCVVFFFVFLWRCFRRVVMVFCIFLNMIFV